MTEIANHLWQSTLFAAVAALVAFACRNNRASLRHAIWLAASLKFLLPFSPLVWLGLSVNLHSVQPAQVERTMSAEVITSSFETLPVLTNVAVAKLEASWWPVALLAIWILGAVVLAARLIRSWLTLHAIVRNASPVEIESPIPVLASRSALFEPGVFGFFKPVLLLPQGIAEVLAAEEFDAIAAHEFTHVRRRDNFTSALHMLVETLFWFHPLVWWIGGKSIEERERACDEAVIEAGKQPHVYAQGIVNVCKHYVESPLACAAGIGGGTLRQRIEDILEARVAETLSGSRKAALACVCLAAFTVPFAVGVLRAQTLPPPPKYKFEVASVRPGDPNSQGSSIRPGPQGGIRTENTTIMTLLSFAYDLREFQVAGGPEWIRSARWNITGTPDVPEEAPGPGMSREKMEAGFKRHGQRMQALLAERFGLVLRVENREMPVYTLKVGRDGHKLVASKEGPHMRNGRNQMEGAGAEVSMLVRALSSQLGRPVIDETGLAGGYSFKL